MAVIRERQADLEAHRFATTTPTPALVAFLRETLTPRLVAGSFDARTAQAWMQGMNPMLDDRSPAWVLRQRADEDGDPDTLRWLAQPLPEVLVRCGVRDLDLSAATGPQRELTQAIARELYLHGDTHAIDDPSRYGATIRCIARFETDGNLPDIKPISTPWSAPCDSTACRGSCSGERYC